MLYDFEGDTENGELTVEENTEIFVLNKVTHNYIHVYTVELYLGQNYEILYASDKESLFLEECFRMLSWFLLLDCQCFQKFVFCEKKHELLP